MVLIVRDARCLDQGFSERMKSVSAEFVFEPPFRVPGGPANCVFELHALSRQSDETAPPIRQVNVTPDVSLALEISEQVVDRLL
jgi:hypothetical protein